MRRSTAICDWLQSQITEAGDRLAATRGRGGFAVVGDGLVRRLGEAMPERLMKKAVTCINSGRRCR
ncbi:hypothetical protein ACIBQ5_15540 [Streptomyces massasporeus]|uniref:hypothetical protein n=1 Tax=Streptomyces massasporeus TaxID=67324 RepID=UPI0037A8BF19